MGCFGWIGLDSIAQRVKESDMLLKAGQSSPFYRLEGSNGLEIPSNG